MLKVSTLKQDFVKALADAILPSRLNAIAVEEDTFLLAHLSDNHNVADATNLIVCKHDR